MAIGKGMLDSPENCFKDFCTYCLPVLFLFLHPFRLLKNVCIYYNIDSFCLFQKCLQGVWSIFPKISFVIYLSPFYIFSNSSMSSSYNTFMPINALQICAVFHVLFMCFRLCIPYLLRPWVSHQGPKCPPWTENTARGMYLSFFSPPLLTPPLSPPWWWAVPSAPGCTRASIILLKAPEMKNTLESFSINSLAFWRPIFNYSMCLFSRGYSQALIRTFSASYLLTKFREHRNRKLFSSESRAQYNHVR